MPNPRRQPTRRERAAETHSVRLRNDSGAPEDEYEPAQVVPVNVATPIILAVYVMCLALSLRSGGFSMFRDRAQDARRFGFVHCAGFGFARDILPHLCVSA